MRYPHEKKEDIEARMAMLEVMEIALRTGNIDTAKSIGESSNLLGNKIDHYEYPESVLEKAAKRIRAAGFIPQYFKP